MAISALAGEQQVTIAAVRGVSYLRRMKRRACESARSEVTGVAFIQGVTFARKKVTYYEVNGLALVEGDICIGTVESVQAQMRTTLEPEFFSAIVSNAELRWPGAIIPFEIHPALPGKQRILDAIAHWEQMTPLRFPRRTAAHSDYLRFMDDRGECWSHVGRRGGTQDLSIGASCGTGTVIHELGHAAGLWHEQSREDRDEFVTVEWDNIAESDKSQFEQHISDGDDVGPYDYESIMHYGRKQFSKNGRDTLVPSASGVRIGQRDGLSAGDIAAVRVMYEALLPV